MKKSEVKDAVYRAEMYRQTFGTESGKWTLNDLLKEARKAGFHPDPYIHARNTGARETIQQISIMISDENYEQLKKMENEQ